MKGLKLKGAMMLSGRTASNVLLGMRDEILLSVKAWGSTALEKKRLAALDMAAAAMRAQEKIMLYGRTGWQDK